MSDEVVIRKLIADGDGTSEDKRILQLISLIEALGSADADSKMFVVYYNPIAIKKFFSTFGRILSKISIALDQIELSIKKQCLVSSVLDEDTKHNEELFVNIDTHLEREEERLGLVKMELTDAKLVRKNREEYDALAKLIKERPSRDETREALHQLQLQLDKDLERQKSLEQMLSDRRKSIQALAVLLNSLEEDAEIIANVLDTTTTIATTTAD